MSYRPALCGVSILLVSLVSATAVAQVSIDVAGAAATATQPVPARLTVVPMTVEGIVLDPDYKPIASAKVLLVQASSGTEPKTVEATTDAAGRFKVEGDSTMRVVVAQAQGFGIGGEQVLTSPAAAAAAVTPKPTVIVLSPAAEVRIKVLDPDGKPATGLVVNFGGDGVSRTRAIGRSAYLTNLPKELESHFKQTTDAQGIATFKSWPQDFSTVVDVEDDRYARVGSSEMITIQRAAVTDYTLRLEKASSVSGKVVIEETKAPAAGVQLQLVPADPNNDIGSRADVRPVVTDAEGKFSFKRLSAGEYELTGALPAALSSKYAPPVMSGINLPKGAAYDGIDVLVNAGVTITGKVTARDGGAPISNVRVQARDPQGRYATNTSVTTGEDGVYSIHMTPGDRMISVQPIYSGPTPPTTRYSSISRQLTVTTTPMPPVDFQLNQITGATGGRGVMTIANGVVVAGSGATTRGARGAIAAAPAGPPLKVKGSVVDLNGKPVPYAIIGVETPVDRNSDVFVSGRIAGLGDTSRRADGEGKFEIPNVPAGSVVRAQTLKLATLKATPIPANEQEIKLVVQSEGMTAARFKIVDIDAKPIKGASLSLIITTTDGGGISLGQDTRTTGDDGSWTFTSLQSDGTYSVQATAKGFGRASAKIQVQPGTSAEQTLTLKRIDSFVAGMALDDTGNPLPNARIRAVGQSGGTQTYVNTDEAGNFRIENFVKDEPVTIYLMDSNRTLTSQRGVAGKDELIVLQRPANTAPAGARVGGRGVAP